MLRKEIRIKKLLLGVFVLLFVAQISLLDANAASTGWTLRYSKGAPTSDNITSWTKTVKASQNGTAYLSVTSFSSDNGNAMAAANTDGTWLMVTRPVSKIAKKTVKKGDSVLGQMKITKTSNLIYFRSAGKFYY